MIHPIGSHSDGNVNVPREQEINRIVSNCRELQRHLKGVCGENQELNICIRSHGGFEYEILESEFPVGGGFAPDQTQLRDVVSMSLTSFDPA